jgi:hypothetical protein
MNRTGPDCAGLDVKLLDISDKVNATWASYGKGPACHTYLGRIALFGTREKKRN